VHHPPIHFDATRGDHLFAIAPRAQACVGHGFLKSHALRGGGGLRLGHGARTFTGTFVATARSLHGIPRAAVRRWRKYYLSVELHGPLSVLPRCIPGGWMAQEHFDVVVVGSGFGSLFFVEGY